MKNLYARAVLWLIAPALRLKFERECAEIKQRLKLAPDDLLRVPTLFPGEPMPTFEPGKDWAEIVAQRVAEQRVKKEGK